MPASLSDVNDVMRQNGARTIIFKVLANNDNSKNQIYFASNLAKLNKLPLGNVQSSGESKKKGAQFKAPLPARWIDLDGNSEEAPGSQAILYPDYPEVRLSGIVKNCPLAPGDLLAEPSREERLYRSENALNRCLVIGIREEEVLFYLSDWGSDLSREAEKVIADRSVEAFTSLFYEYLEPSRKSSKELLIDELRAIFAMGDLPGSILDKNNNIIPYRAKNAAGMTLESHFGIRPNGIPGPDYLDWELKAHSKSAITLMTPEPDSGFYRQDFEDFMERYATNRKLDRLDFTGQHKPYKTNPKNGLTMELEGYDQDTGKMTNSDGGLRLVDQQGNVAAGWSFSTILNLWRKKHENTCFVRYSSFDRDQKYFRFGPKVKLCQGANIKNYLNALSSSAVYFDPGMNLKWENGRWKQKRRSQFRTTWRNVDHLYDSAKEIEIS